MPFGYEPLACAMTERAQKKLVTSRAGPKAPFSVLLAAPTFSAPRLVVIDVFDFLKDF